MSLTRRQLLAFSLLLASALPVVADDGGHDNGGEEHDGEREGDKDHDDARDAVKRGDIIPLHEALEIIEETNRGHVIDMRLTKGTDGYVYAFKLKTRGGRVTTLKMDARTGHVISMFGS